LNDTLRFIECACSILSNVWVGRLELHFVGRSILESISLKTAVATTGLSVAINELGLSELDKFIGLDEMSTLHGGGGSEGPA